MLRSPRRMCASCEPDNPSRSTIVSAIHQSRITSLSQTIATIAYKFTLHGYHFRSTDHVTPHRVYPQNHNADRYATPTLNAII
jgi:hypothetical protein